MKKIIKKIDNIVRFPKKLNNTERQVEAILFAAAEPLDVETIEKRVQSTNNIKKILEKLKLDYSARGVNLVCIKEKWSFRTSENLSKLMSLQKSTQKKLKNWTSSSSGGASGDFSEQLFFNNIIIKKNANRYFIFTPF